jgi:recombinational DNA repair ATPase RecF
LEIANFHKLLSVRIARASTTTLLVGANNSGKSSAMLALRKFLLAKATAFRLQDLTLAHLTTINDSSGRLLGQRQALQPLAQDRFEAFVAACAQYQRTLARGFQPRCLLRRRMPRQARKPCCGWIRRSRM